MNRVLVVAGGSISCNIMDKVSNWDYVIAADKGVKFCEELDIVPDFFEIELKDEDRILLCSDGLSNMIEDDEIRDIVMDNPLPKESVEQLIDRANYYGGKDNIGVVIAVQ